MDGVLLMLPHILDRFRNKLKTGLLGAVVYIMKVNYLNSVDIIINNGYNIFKSCEIWCYKSNSINLFYKYIISKEFSCK